MDSLNLRIAAVFTIAVSVPVLLILLPQVAPTGVGPGVVVLMVVGWSLVVIGVIGTGSWIVVRSLLRPLADLTQALNPARRVGSSTSFGEQPREPLEVRLLRGAVFGRDVARRREADERSTYVSTLIHDMKTPLLGIDRSLDLALTANDGVARSTWLEAASLEIRRLLSLVQDVVDAERLASGTLHVRGEPVDLGDLCARVAKRVAHLNDDVDVRVQVKARRIHMCDPGLMERAIENIAANAVHHARKVVNLEVLSGVIRVADDGPGLPTDFAGVGLVVPARTSAPGVTSSTYRSSGLGLFIAKRVAEAHGGRLVLESTGDLGTVLLLYVGEQALDRSNV